MTRKIAALASLLRLVPLFYGTIVSAQDAKDWYPLKTGDAWTYQKEFLNGDMAHPDVEHWTTQETIVDTVTVTGLPGTLVTKRTRVLARGPATGFWAAKEVPESHLLIYKTCVYVLDGFDAEENWIALHQKDRLSPEFTNDVVRGNIPADFCFPMAKGMTWGKVRDTSPAGEWIWQIEGLNDGPFGLPGAKTFHLSSYEGSGTRIDRWFEQGIGVVQEVIEHHGTYEENRRMLLSATIDGKIHSYQLPRARTVPLSKEDCDGSGWRHFSRANGSSFGNLADCVTFWSAEPKRD